MPQIPTLASGSTLELITSVLAYWTAVGTFVITAFVIFVTVIMIRSPIKENTRARKQEENQKRIENALDLIKIVAGVKDLRPDGVPDAFLQLSCLEALSNFPEYFTVYVYMLEYYKNDATWPAGKTREQFVAVSERLVAKTEPKNHA
jgi:hypothetical protein